MVGFGESYFQAFAVLLKASSIQLGLIGSLPQFLGSMSQLFSDRLMVWIQSRQRFVCRSALLQALMFIPIIFVFIWGRFSLWAFLAFISLYWIFGFVLGPAWISWIGDLVPERKRGLYFGRRNRIMGLVTFLSLVAGGAILQIFFNTFGTAYGGFLCIFFLAFIMRLCSFAALRLKYEPPFQPELRTRGQMADLFLNKANNNYRFYVFYLSLINGAIYLSAPFFAPYMLVTLKFSYMRYTMITATLILVKFIMMPVWGRLMDRYGAKKILSITGMTMPLVPLFWVFSANVFYLIAVQCYSGFVWAGFELAAFNFIYNISDKKMLPVHVTYYTVFNGVAMLAGGLSGGVIARFAAPYVPAYLFIFFLSFVLRLLAAICFLPLIHEPRTVRSVSFKQLAFLYIAHWPHRGMIYSQIILRKSKRYLKKRVTLNKP